MRPPVYDVINCGIDVASLAMTNVFTAANFLPRSTTLSDFRGHDATKHRVFPRILSPTRRANPHPIGLKYQLIGQKKPSFGIWHPDFHRIDVRMPDMLKHLGHVNFTCSLPVVHKLEYGNPPNIQYTENTTSRKSYVEPCRFPHLVKINPHSRKTRYGYTPEACRKPVKGIEPLSEPKRSLAKSVIRKRDLRVMYFSKRRQQIDQLLKFSSRLTGPISKRNKQSLFLR